MNQSLTNRDLKHLLDHMIQTARDTQLGYQVAADHVENPELEQLFTEYVRQRQAFVTQLQYLEPPLFDEDPADGPSPAGKLVAGWIGFREAANWESEKVVLAEIGKMEQHAIGVVEAALRSGGMPSAITDVLEHQLSLYREGAARAHLIYEDPNKSDRGAIPGTYTLGSGSTRAGRAPVPPG